MEKYAIVTGTSSGLGLAMTEFLLEEGYFVFGASRSGSSIIHQNYLDIICDVRDEGSVEEFFVEVQRVTGEVELLVNNAGAMLMAPISETSSQEFHELLETNVLGVFHFLKFFEEYLIEDKSHIVNILSLASKEPFPQFAAYTASKYAMRGLVETARLEWAKYNVRFTNLLPGPIATPIWDKWELGESEREMMKLEDFLRVFGQVISGPPAIQFPDITFYSSTGFLI